MELDLIGDQELRRRFIEAVKRVQEAEGGVTLGDAVTIIERIAARLDAVADERDELARRIGNEVAGREAERKAKAEGYDRLAVSHAERERLRRQLDEVDALLGRTLVQRDDWKRSCLADRAEVTRLREALRDWCAELIADKYGMGYGAPAGRFIAAEVERRFLAPSRGTDGGET